jgi:hypothetical protein
MKVEDPADVRLQREMHDALRAKDPEWILATGDCPGCNSYDVRLAESLMQLAATGSLGLKPGNTYRSQREFQHRPRFSTTRGLQ